MRFSCSSHFSDVAVDAVEVSEFKFKMPNQCLIQVVPTVGGFKIVSYTDCNVFNVGNPFMIKG